MLKTLRPQGDETDVAAYLGSMLAGEIETWGITSEEDFWPMELGYYRTDMTRPVMNAGPYSMARNLYGSKKLMNGVFPSTPWGIAPIFGPGVAPSTGGIATTIQTDGEVIMRGGARLAAKDAMPEVVRTVRAAAARLPFRADGGVFLSARRNGDRRYQVFLMDTEMFAPADIETTVTTTIPNLRCHDEITGEQLKMQDNQVTLTVPAGAFRLLGFVGNTYLR